ncbi:MAG: hypothetical protein IPK02_05515 [Candidatus Accumulibacter sp.]|uniref:Uncharacterized protein n=1 Tax=Candidatus Accumulibacter affinis TaxID=2954384 RepID=A0A935W418_9PROT|nr:hypothetical protein [Candidatus Accumulibacter affinis]
MAPFAEALPSVEGCLHQFGVSGSICTSAASSSSPNAACTPGRPSRAEITIIASSQLGAQITGICSGERESQRAALRLTQQDGDQCRAIDDHRQRGSPSHPSPENLSLGALIEHGADERARQSRGYEPAAGRRQTGWQEGPQRIELKDNLPD